MRAWDSIVIVAAVLGAAAPAAAQPASVQRADRQSRYEIGQMERVLEGAVEHGAAITRDRLKAVLETLAPGPAGDTLMSGDNARARGFRLEGYGLFFDVAVPPFDTETTFLWSVRTLDQNDLGLDSALKELQTWVKNSGNANLEQALKRVQLQVTPSPLTRLAAAATADAGTLTGSAASAPDRPAQPVADPILNDPNEAYRTEVVQALKDAMLDHSASLNIGPNDWLTVAARANDDRPRLAPADTESRTRLLRLRGSDLAAYLARQITRQEAQDRIEVRIF